MVTGQGIPQCSLHDREKQALSNCDVAVAVNAGRSKQVHAAEPTRSCKYNQLLRIEEALGNMAVYGYRK
jgi:enolase